MLPLKHIEKRKKKKLSKPLSHSQLDQLVYLISFLGPLLTVPQIYDVWMNKSLTANPITWTSYVIFAVIWLIYGVKHDQKPIIFSNLLWISVDILVVIGIAIH